jgi:ferredoxin-NAD(P)+ reductase (naphthalene dioxygenase ferredoxin-specific)
MSFTITVADTNQSVAAEGGDTILSALLDHGVGFAYSCQAGNCGTCRCELVAGEIFELEYSEHALSAEERARNIVLACRSQVWSDVVVRQLDAEEFVVHPSRILRCRVLTMDHATHDVLRLRLEVLAGGPFSFSAGQFAKLSFPFLRTEERDYSMANTPEEKILEFHIRVMAQGSVSRRVSESLKPGDEVRVFGPLGSAYLRAQHQGPMLCIAGGTGLAPIRSIVRGALDAGVQQPIHVYFGARAERDVYLESELAELAARHANLKLSVVLSEVDGASREGSGRRHGLVSDAVAADFADLSGFKVYMAGPPPMVDAATALVQARGVAHRDIHADAFYPAAPEPSLLGAP